MKVSTEIDNNFGYEKITQLVDNIPLSIEYIDIFTKLHTNTILYIPHSLTITIRHLFALSLLEIITI